MNQDMSSLIGASNKDYVTSLARGLAVIRCFDKDRNKLTLTEVARHTSLARATARRFLYTLNALGYVETDGKLFWLSPRVLNLGYAYLISQPMVELLQPYIKEVSDLTGESCSVSVLDLPDIVYIARCLTHQIVSVSLNVGARLPALTTSMGRILLAAKTDAEVEAFVRSCPHEKLTEHTLTCAEEIMEEIQKARRNGYSLVREELEIGLSSISVPIKNAHGKVLATANVSFQTQKMDEQKVLTEILPHLQRSAEHITEVLGSVESLGSR